MLIEIGYGMSIEVTERNRDDDRERDNGVISPAARSQQDRGLAAVVTALIPVLGPPV